MNLPMKKRNPYLVGMTVSGLCVILSGIWLIPVIGCAPVKTWTKTEIALALTAAVSTGLDWGQTRHIGKNPETHRERNRILGEHPSVQRVDTYFLSSVILGSLIAHYGPSLINTVIPQERGIGDNFRWIWLAGWTGVEGYTVENNINKGLNPRW